MWQPPNHESTSWIFVVIKSWGFSYDGWWPRNFGIRRKQLILRSSMTITKKIQKDQYDKKWRRIWFMTPPPKKKTDFATDHKSLWTPWEIGSVDLISARSTFAQPVIGDYQHLGLRVFRFRKLKGWLAGENVTFLGEGVISGICIYNYIQYDYIRSCIMIYVYNYIYIHICDIWFIYPILACRMNITSRIKWGAFKFLISGDVLATMHLSWYLDVPGS